MRNQPEVFFQIRDQVSAIIADLEFYSYYQLLGVEQDASPTVCTYQFHAKKREYQEIQKSIHCPAGLYQDLSTLLDRLEEANVVLSDARLRQQYDTNLDLGQTRHEATVAARASAPRAASGPKGDEYLDVVTSGLERRLSKELLDAGEGEDDGPGLDDDFLDEALSDLKGKLAEHGVDLNEDVEDEEPDDGFTKEEFAGQAVEDLQSKLADLGVQIELHDREDNPPPKPRRPTRRSQEIVFTPPSDSLSSSPAPGAPRTPAFTPPAESLPRAPQRPARTAATPGVVRKVQPAPPPADDDRFDEVIMLDDED